jgi:protein-tyrosine-phosphatase
MASTRTVLFLCPHGAAKSVMAAAYCQQLADERHLPLIATLAGTDPDPDIAPGVVAGLRAEAIDVSDHRPRRVTSADVESTWRVVLLGCDLNELPLVPTPIAQWDEVPPASQGFAATRAAILAHLADFLDTAAVEIGGDPTTQR